MQSLLLQAMERNWHLQKMTLIVPWILPSLIPDCQRNNDNVGSSDETFTSLPNAKWDVLGRKNPNPVWGHSTGHLVSSWSQICFAAICREVSPRQTAKICCYTKTGFVVIVYHVLIVYFCPRIVCMSTFLKISCVVYCFWKASLALSVMAKEERELGLSVTD